MASRPDRAPRSGGDGSRLNVASQGKLSGQRPEGLNDRAIVEIDQVQRVSDLSWRPDVGGVNGQGALDVDGIGADRLPTLGLDSPQQLPGPVEGLDASQALVRDGEDAVFDQHDGAQELELSGAGSFAADSSKEAPVGTEHQNVAGRQANQVEAAGGVPPRSRYRHLDHPVARICAVFAVGHEGDAAAFPAGFPQREAVARRVSTASRPFLPLKRVIPGPPRGPEPKLPTNWQRDTAQYPTATPASTVGNLPAIGGVSKS